jgi:hypothetical protein
MRIIPTAATGTATPPDLLDDVAQVVNESLEVLVGSLVQALLIVPAPIVAVVVGLVVWRGGHLLAGTTSALLVGWLAALPTWAVVVESLLLALSGCVIAALVLAPAALRWGDRDHLLLARHAAARSAWIAIALLLGTTILALLGGPHLAGSHLPWILGTGLVVSTTVMWVTSRTYERMLGPTIILRAVASGIAASLAVGAALGLGLGGMVLVTLRGSAGIAGLAVASPALLLLAVAAVIAGSTRPPADPAPAPTTPVTTTPVSDEAVGPPLEAAVTGEFRIPPTPGEE